MKQDEWKKLQEQEYTFLDTLDLRQIICEMKDESVHEIISKIEDLYEEDYLKNNPDDEMLFNVISSDEFVEYINKRYGIRYIEEVRYYFDI
jgi:hypothetical protein